MARLAVDIQQTSSGTAVSRLQSDLRQIESSTGRASGAMSKWEGNTKKATGATGGLASVLGKLAGGFAIADLASKAGAAIVQFGKDSVRAGSDLQQSSGAAEAVFGKNYAQIAQAAQGAAQAVGLSRSEYQQMAAVLGAGLKNQGLEDYAGSTQKVIGLGADLAAQFGGSTKEAVEAIGSLMRGEADPIEKYGVSIKQSAINAELAAKGQDKLTGAARTQAEAQARLKLLFDQTTQAQGANAKEAGTLAGVQQRLSAQTEDVKAKIGTALLPALTQLLSWLNRTMQGTNSTAAVLKSIFGPALAAARQAIAMVSGALSDGTARSNSSRAALSALGTVVKVLASAFGSTLAGGITAAGYILTGIIKTANAVASAASWVAEKVRGMGSALGGISAGGLGGVLGTIQSISSAAQSAIGWLKSLAGAASSASFSAGAIQSLGRSVDGGFMSQSLATVPVRLPEMRPTINISIPGDILRGVIRSEVRAALTSTGGTLA